MSVEYWNENIMLNIICSLFKNGSLRRIKLSIEQNTEIKGQRRDV